MNSTTGVVARVGAAETPQWNDVAPCAAGEIDRTAVCGKSASTVGREGCVMKTRKRHAVREMKEGPSEPLCRGRLQTAMSCFGQKPRW